MEIRRLFQKLFHPIALHRGAFLPKFLKEDGIASIDSIYLLKIFLNFTESTSC